MDLKFQGTANKLLRVFCQEKVRALEKQNAVLRQNRESRGEVGPEEPPAPPDTGMMGAIPAQRMSHRTGVTLHLDPISGGNGQIFI